MTEEQQRMALHLLREAATTLKTTPYDAEFEETICLNCSGTETEEGVFQHTSTCFISRVQLFLSWLEKQP